MRKQLSFWSAVLIGALLLVDAGFVRAQSDREMQAVEATERINSRLFEAVIKGDADAVAALYTADAVLMPPRGKMLRGTSSIRDYWATSIKMAKVLRITARRVEFRLHNDTAHDAGTYSLTYKLTGEESEGKDEGKYLIIWKRQRDGQWRLHIDIWNSDTAG